MGHGLVQRLVGLRLSDNRILMIIDVVGGTIRKGSSVENLGGAIGALARHAPNVRPSLHATLPAVPPEQVPLLAPPMVASE